MSRARDIANLQSSKITADAGIDIDNIKQKFKDEYNRSEKKYLFLKLALLLLTNYLIYITYQLLFL